MNKALPVFIQNQLYKNAYKRAFFRMFGLVFKEIRVSFRQFYTWRHPISSFIRCLILLFSVLVRWMLGRSVHYSFGFTGEDRIIEGILKPRIQMNGFYVEVGCNHPKFLSNTYGLYRKGWRGICIDGNENLIQKYSFYRPRDNAICAVISDVVEEKTFYKVQNDVLSTLDPELAKSYRSELLEVSPVDTLTHTLTQILDRELAPRNFQLLSIDAEEHDFEVLKSLDFKRYRPELVVIEDETFEMLKPEENKISQFLNSHGYQLEGYVLKNLYFTIL